MIAGPTDAQIGTTLMLRRLELGLTIQEVSDRLERAGVSLSRPTVKAIEIGDRRLLVTELWKFADVLDLSPDCLLRRIAERTHRTRTRFGLDE